MPTTYGYDTAYSLKSHCGVKGVGLAREIPLTMCCFIKGKQE